MKNQNHSYATPMKPGKKGLNMISDIVKIRGIRRNGPILYFMENMVFITLDDNPPGLFRTELKTGVRIRSRGTDSTGTTDDRVRLTFQRRGSKRKENAILCLRGRLRSFLTC